jgi:hypothetical protein
VGWDGRLPRGRPERWKVPRVRDWLERLGGREVGRSAVFLVGGRFSFSGLKGCSRIAPILLLSLREDVVRSVWTFGQTYNHFQNFLSTNCTRSILTFCLYGILIDSLSLTATQTRCSLPLSLVNSIESLESSQPQPSQRRNGRTTRPTSALSNVLLSQDFDPEEPRDR